MATRDARTLLAQRHRVERLCVLEKDQFHNILPVGYAMLTPFVLQQRYANFEPTEF